MKTKHNATKILLLLKVHKNINLNLFKTKVSKNLCTYKIMIFLFTAMHFSAIALNESRKIF